MTGTASNALMVTGEVLFSDIALEGSATSQVTGWGERRPAKLLGEAAAAGGASRKNTA